MPIALIAAAAGKKQVIGKNGDLPWHFSSDLKFFKEKTLGHTVIMGRVTYQSIVKRLGKPLPGRRNIVLTRDASFADERVTIAHDWSQVDVTGDDLQFVIGGESIYRAALDHADLIYLTHIDQEVEGDAYFPAFDHAKWNLIEEKPLSEQGVTLRFCTYKRRLP
jgi:dihydrofolate reductase